ncbi:50S ribosomal protein L23 [Thiospirochaeta perfilievii]|uniref:Large ribosomal subunit protein uL23 n=1 Tax=Thiospirochaeta perfilievii TaxID=252967 RepID=A0A5C1QCT8_9SPIO|nr:50S ribosomal protein L23 [Thiospirochaeta perfilievii]QEN05158.1 50S ribosomal protein L23 [Thiospirochaeta perfilievii]
MTVDQIILEPVITEKSINLRENAKKQYTFKVNVKANKLQIKRAVSKLFSVTATDCNIVNVKRKQKANLPVSRASYKRGHGFTAAWKKAIVTLADGERIDMFEGA